MRHKIPLITLNDKIIKTEKKHLLMICNTLTYGLGTEYVNIEEIDDIEFLKEISYELEYHIEKLHSLMDDIDNRVDDLNGVDESIN